MNATPLPITLAGAALLAAASACSGDPASDHRGPDGGASDFELRSGEQPNDFGSCEHVMEMPQGWRQVSLPDNACQKETQVGDYEIIIDGDNVLLVMNDPSVRGPRQDVVVATIDGADGTTVLDTESVATNYRGCFGINGPEWFRPPAAGPIDLGIIFPGASTSGASPRDGVHAVFRRTGATAFDTELAPDGSPRAVSMDGDDPVPSLLPSSPAGAYPDGAPAAGQLGYVTFQSSACQGKCFGLINSVPNGSDTTMTSMPEQAEANNMNHHASIGHILDPSGTRVLTAACEPGRCGLYTSNIDGAGGLVQHNESDFVFLGNVGGPSTSSAIAAGVFPDGTGKCGLVFVNQVNADAAGNDAIHVFRQHASDLTRAQRVATVTQRSNGAGLGAIEHFRVEASRDELVLHYLDRDAQNERESFVVRVPVGCDSSEPLPVTLYAEHLTPAGDGTELVWLPDADVPWSETPGGWAAYIVRANTLQAPNTAKEIARCWWRPSEES